MATRHSRTSAELGFQERRTADFVAKKLKEFGVEVHRGTGKTGVVSVLRVGNDTNSVGCAPTWTRCR